MLQDDLGLGRSSRLRAGLLSVVVLLRKTEAAEAARHLPCPSSKLPGEGWLLCYGARGAEKGARQAVRPSHQASGWTQPRRLAPHASAPSPGPVSKAEGGEAWFSQPL